MSKEAKKILYARDLNGNPATECPHGKKGSMELSTYMVGSMACELCPCNEKTGKVLVMCSYE